MRQLSDFDNIDELIVDPLTYADPELYHNIFQALRHEDPIHWTASREYRPFWAITRHADVMSVEFNAQNFLNDPRSYLLKSAEEDALFEQTGSHILARTLTSMDNPDHRVYRALTSAWFGPKSIKGLEAEIQMLARTTVDKMLDSGDHCDFVKDIAAWYPLRTIMMVLGVPPEDEPLMLELTQAFFGSTDPETGGGGADSMREAFRRFSEYFEGITQERLGSPRNDIATVLSTAMINGEPIAASERSAYYLIIAAAGHDTTSSAIAGGLLELIRHPEQLALLKKSPDLMANAVDEIIRWTSPVKHFFRTAVEDAVVAGVEIKAGQNLMMCYPSANRDEKVFEKPNEFRIDRPDAKKHLAFGYGPHLCLGNTLAKMEIKALFAEIIERVDDIEISGQPAWVEANFVSGLKRLPIKYRPR